MCVLHRLHDLTPSHVTFIYLSHSKLELEKRDQRLPVDFSQKEDLASVNDDPRKRSLHLQRPLVVWGFARKIIETLFYSSFHFLPDSKARLKKAWLLVAALLFRMLSSFVLYTVSALLALSFWAVAALI